MKPLTKAQKTAIIDLIKSKAEEKQKYADKQFINKNKKTISSAIKDRIEKEQEALQLVERLNKLIKETDGNKIFRLDGIRVDYDWHTDGCKLRNGTHSEEDLLELVITPTIIDLNYEDIKRDLELATIGGEFDIKKFIEKYIK